jgi:phage recombination protein Bet
MSQALAKIPTTPPPAATKPSALNLMAGRLNCDPAKLLNTLKATVFSKATDEELMALVLVANEYGLNPLLKELYAFPAKGGGIIPIVSVDGWNKMLLRQDSFDGISFAFEEDERRQPITCTATVYVKGRSHPVVVTEYFSECYRKTDNWENMPHRMLRNRTLCQAARMAFGFSGVSHEEEVPTTVEIESTVITSAPEAPAKLITAPATVTPQSELEAFVVGAGFDFDTFQRFAAEGGGVNNADTLTGFSEVSTDDARRLLRGKGRLPELLALAKNGGAK